jgi:hypothetical protein
MWQHWSILSTLLTWRQLSFTCSLQALIERFFCVATDIVKNAMAELKRLSGTSPTPSLLPVKVHSCSRGLLWRNYSTDVFILINKVIPRGVWSYHITLRYLTRRLTTWPFVYLFREACLWLHLVQSDGKYNVSVHSVKDKIKNKCSCISSPSCTEDWLSPGAPHTPFVYEKRNGKL